MNGRPAIAFKATAIWMVILVGAMLNGVAREAVLLPRLEPSVAYVASGVLLCLIIVLTSVALIPGLGPLSTAGSLGVGTFWLCLTLAFEFGVCRFVQHRSWTEMLEAYTFKDGNIWPVVLLVTLLAPLVAVRLRADDVIEEAR
jgi:hypothetical protein